MGTEKCILRIKRGETLGLIGHNGAGKTTLLRMLNGLIKPDAGRITVKGRMQALIALGAGFNPVLTGKENIYINASVLGIPKTEVDKRLDDIIEFSGINEFINTPVQSYSSGMRVRLGFSVAAHMNPDILLVDEVLAVGDLTFQAKCRNRIQELMENGVAIVLVSHNLHSISYICSRTVVFERGDVIFDGDTEKAIDIYRTSMTKYEGAEPSRAGTGEVKITKFELLNNLGSPQFEYDVGDSVRMRIHYHADKKVQDPVINVAIYAQGGSQMTGIRTDADGVKIGTIEGEGFIDIHIGNFNLLPNIYTLTATIFHPDGFAFYDRITGIAQLKVSGGHMINGLVHLPHAWETSQINLASSQITDGKTS